MLVLPATPQELEHMEIHLVPQELEVNPIHLDIDHPTMPTQEPLVSLEPHKAPAPSYLHQVQEAQEAELPMAFPPPATPMPQEADQAQVEPPEESPMELHQDQPQLMVLQVALDPHTEPPPPPAELPMVPQEHQARPMESPLLPLVQAMVLLEQLEPTEQEPPMEAVRVVI